MAFTEEHKRCMLEIKVDGEWIYSSRAAFEEFQEEFPHMVIHFDHFNRNVQRIVSLFRETGSVGRKEGYAARTIEERIDGTTCLNSILTTANSSALLALIHLQDRGSLKYTTREFTFLINQLATVILSVMQHFPKELHPSRVLTSLLLEPLSSSEFFYLCQAQISIIQNYPR